MFEILYKIKGHDFIKTDEDKLHEYLECRNCKYNNFVYSKNSGESFYVVDSVDYFYPIIECEKYLQQVNLKYDDHDFQIIKDYKSYIELICKFCNNKFEYRRSHNYYVMYNICNQVYMRTKFKCDDLVIKGIIE